MRCVFVQLFLVLGALSSVAHAKVKVIDAKGNIVVRDWALESTLEWKTLGAAATPARRPFLSYRIKPSNNESIQKVNDKAIKLTRISDKEAQIDLDNVAASVPVEVQTVLGDGKPGGTLPILLSPGWDKNTVLFHPECSSLGLSLDVQGPDFVYAIVDCRSVGADTVEIALFHSGFKELSASPQVKPVKESSEWAIYRVKRPEKDNIPLLTLQSADKQSKLVFNLRPQSKWFFASTGLGFTFFNHEESSRSTTINDLAMTFKGGAGVQLLNERLVIDASGYINLFSIPISHTPSDRVSPRFWGANFRISTPIPFQHRYYKLSVGLGTYLWGMLVNAPAAETYGVKLMSGLQIFVLNSFQRNGKHFAEAYAKYAPISSAPSGFFGFDNYELAVGGAIRAWEPHAKFPMFVTLDLSGLKIAEADGAPYSIRLVTVSAGVSFRY